ncbi:MAG: T9SS type A sorting domain-containing protein [bacterium]
MNKLKTAVVIFSLAFVFIGWGGDGHQIINNNSVYSLPANASYLISWQIMLKEHASDADYRKGDDPTEAPKHYIDIDNYPEFVTNGYISQSLDSLIQIYGNSFVYDQGILPWAVLASYDSLKSAFIHYNWDKAVLYAADLGHYIGDAAMPMHITKNYNGQLTNQSGIHSRYETKMIDRYKTEIVYSYDMAQKIENVPNYVFNYLYSSYPYVDSLLSADIQAKGFAGGSYNTNYYTKLWSLTKNFTIKLFAKSSLGLASLIYTAWVESGSPTPTGVEENNETNPNCFQVFQNYPNPFNGSTIISYYLPKDGNVSFNIYDCLGNKVYNENIGFKNSGKQTISYHTSNNLSSGVYIYQIEANGIKQNCKMLLLK